MLKLLFGGSIKKEKEKEIEMKKQNVLSSVYTDIRISTEPNKDETYMYYGIIHKCKAVAISNLSENFSDIANFFGSSGYDGVIFDKVRNLCLIKLTETLNDLTFFNPINIYKISNLKMEFISIDKNSITVNAYGSLYTKEIEEIKDI
jgi:hypothetical protein